MNEVSARVLSIWAKPLRAKGLALADVLDGTSLEPSVLRNRHARIDWTQFCTIHRNLRRHFSDEELVEVGRSYFRAPALRFVFVVGRLLLTPMGFYRWLNKPRQGVGNQMFDCVIPHHRDISESECELELEIPQGFEVCQDFFLVSRGNMEEMPRLLGYPRAIVELEHLPRGARYHITIPPRTRLLTRIARTLSWPFTARAAARELRDAHEVLQRRFFELEDARSKLDRQADQLRIAHALNELAQRDVELQPKLATIVSALLADARFASAKLTLVGRSEHAAAGEAGDHPVVSRDLVVRTGETVGVLEIASAGDPAWRDALLELVVPTIALAIENALYRAGLERLVDERTRELREARDELARTVGELRDAQEVRQRFFANVSHEFRTPLSLIMLAAADIEALAGGSLVERARADLRAVTDSARKLVRLVDELLLLAAAQEHKLVLHREPTDLAELVRRLEVAWRLAAEAAGLALVVEAPAALAASIDPVAFERVVSNLISNAVKYTPRGGRIEVVLADEPSGLRLSVLDNGPGIAEDLAARLFGRFERAAGEARRVQGTGLGLFVVKQLVEAHGGTVAALARSTGGSELRVVLPESAAIRGPLPRTTPAPLRIAIDAPEQPRPLHFMPPHFSHGTILLADDDAALAEQVARLLAGRYTVFVAHDGARALELARKHQPELLVTDVDMPELDGIELARRFREVTNDRLAPIIMLSAVADLRTRVAGLEAGALDYVTKPFDPLELSARVDAQFRMRELAVRLHRAEQLTALGILTSGLAHELRNPANGIVNAIQPLLELLPAEITRAGTPTAELLDVVSGCAEQVGFLARQLLGVGQGGELELRSTPLADLVARAMALAQRAVAGVQVRADIEPEPVVMCAAPLLAQVLANLVENAGHAAGPGGWVEVRAQRTGGRTVISVADSGPGVPVELRERVFEPFFTTKPEGAGTGLGLSVARAIVQRHHGVLEIREYLGRSAFVIDLPDFATVETANAV